MWSCFWIWVRFTSTDWLSSETLLWNQKKCCSIHPSHILRYRRVMIPFISHFKFILSFIHHYLLLLLSLQSSSFPLSSQSLSSINHHSSQWGLITVRDVTEWHVILFYRENWWVIWEWILLMIHMILRSESVSLSYHHLENVFSIHNHWLILIESNRISWLEICDERIEREWLEENRRVFQQVFSRFQWIQWLSQYSYLIELLIDQLIEWVNIMDPVMVLKLLREDTVLLESFVILKLPLKWVLLGQVE